MAVMTTDSMAAAAIRAAPPVTFLFRFCCQFSENTNLETRVRNSGGKYNWTTSQDNESRTIWRSQIPLSYVPRSFIIKMFVLFLSPFDISLAAKKGSHPQNAAEFIRSRATGTGMNCELLVPF